MTRANAPSPSTSPATVPVWDLPLRLFHWTLAIAVSVSLYTGLGHPEWDSGWSWVEPSFQELDWHQYSGFTVLGLLLFRIGWGFIGSRHARFASFLRGPRAIWQWLAGALRLRPPPSVGHNPLAGWMIMLLLAALLVQGTTGLFATDGLFVEGPLVGRVDGDVSSLMTSIHAWGPWTVGGLVALHLLALLVHRFGFAEALVVPMITGRRRDAPAEAGIEGQRLVSGLLLAAIAAGSVWALVTWG